jgi:GT2 family glycosyltransferase
MKTPLAVSKSVSVQDRESGQGNNRALFHPSFPEDLILTQLSRRPLRLPKETVRVVLEAPIPAESNSKSSEPAVGVSPLVSIVIVTFNNLVVTKLCLNSLLVNTDYPNYEVIVVDNCSDEETVAFLKAVSDLHSRVKVIFNNRNLGFAPANNQGLKAAAGDIFILLNNDTIVPPGWLGRLVKHLEDQKIGLLGPVTNRIGNEAEIETSYQTYGEFLQFAEDYTGWHQGELFDIPMLCMYCLAMRRDTYDNLGPLDEQYEIGMLEDDDYSMRARAANYRVVCAEDVFVHHFGQASFGNLFASGEYSRLLKTNQRRFEKKWGVKWQPYKRRLSKRYLKIYNEIYKVTTEVLPAGAQVLVISKGDENLIRLKGICAFHFPQNEIGEYAGFYPADSIDAIEKLEAEREKGAEFLLIPSTAFWWLDYYKEFNNYLKTKYRIILQREDSCLVFSLEDSNLN